MANKYLIQGATYCGDGTASNEAASAGATGAWNNANVITGTAPAYGSLGVNDVVYCRSKTSAGADVTISTGVNANIGKASQTGNDRVHWIIDGGTVWSGVNGAWTFALSSSVAWTVLAGNAVEAMTQDKLAFTGYAGGHSSNMLIISANAELIRPLIDNTANTYFGAQTALIGTLRSPHLKLKLRYSYGLYVPGYSLGTVTDPDVELTDATETDPIFYASSYGSQMMVYGGSVRGAGAVSGVPVCIPPINQAAGVFLHGFRYPYAMPLTSLSGWATTNGNRVISTGADGAMGATMHQYAGAITSRHDGNYPTLNAVLPDSAATPWSYLIEPRNARKSWPLILPVRKMYKSAAAAKTITLEALVGTQFGEILKNTCWVEFVYVDATTGNTVTLSTYDPAAGALTASTAAWSQTTYGAVSFNKIKFSATTPTSIKQDTVVEARLMVCVPQVVTTEDLLVVCPDVQLT